MNKLTLDEYQAAAERTFIVERDKIPYLLWGLSSCTRHSWIRLSSIVQYSSLLPPVGVWSVSQYQCGGSPPQGPYLS